MKPLIELKLTDTCSISVKANANTSALLAPACRPATVKMLLKWVKKK